MANREVQLAWQYHDGTKHSWDSVRNATHRLDWSNEPVPFKIYPSLEGERLPTDFPFSGVPALQALAGSIPLEKFLPTLQELAGLLYYSAGITKKGIVPGGEIYFRAASCTGALYHIELYLVCGPLLPGLSAGVYHFSLHDFSLRKLRDGDFRGALAESAAGEPSLVEAPAVLVTTSVYWRNAWKYQARAYRHAYWDSGTILANMLVVGAAHQVPLKVVTAFMDEPVNRLLDLDDSREAALQLVSVGRVPGQTPPHFGLFASLGLEVAPYSRNEVDYPQIREMHAASSLALAEEVSELWDSAPAPTMPEPQGEIFPLAQVSEDDLSQEALESVILRRGSSRRFRRAPISFGQLSTLLRRACRDIPADFLGEPGASLAQMYLIINDVEGLPPGGYVFHPEQAELERLRAGDMRQQARYLALQQDLAGDASVNVYFLSDLNQALERYGNRGYRMAQVEAAIRGGFLYLGAYAQRLGATGLTFFDDDVTDFFLPHAEGKSVMFLVALGRPQRRRRG